MTREIERWSEWENLNSATTLLVFPGNGANIVRGFMDADWLFHWRTASATAKRLWIPGEPPQAIAGRIFPDRFVLGVKDIVIIDDVVSSGDTVKKLRTMNMPWIPAARWHVVTWAMQKAANLRGIHSYFAAVEVGESDRKDPINSLSTLIKNVEIAESYARRNFPNPEAFLALLNELR
ncbi:MAG: phosphoribosyltransferase [Candidatus Magasanikbacteria bacterium]|nr:phosphoribosyltransferase [Candidatus Magasanikbacteria bacterium]